MNASPILQLENASVRYGKKNILTDINLRVSQGEWISVMGPNGAGKSTLLKALLGCLPVDGRFLSHGQGIGYVPQHFHLPLNIPITTAEFLQLANAHHPQIIEDLQMRELLPVPLRQLSGGQLQKVLLGFALQNQPDIVLLDEYLHGLDVKSMNRVIGYLEVLKQEKKITVIDVSHDISAVTHSADRVIVLHETILFDGSPTQQGFHECLHDVYGHHHWLQQGTGVSHGHGADH